MATTAHDMDSVSGLLEELKVFDDDLELNEQNRLQMLQVARALVRALETPQETVLRLCWAEPTLYGAIIMAIDTGLFRHMNRCPDLPMTARNLSEFTGVDPTLLKRGRIMKHLAAMGVIHEYGPDEYLPNKLSRTLSLEKYADGFPCMANGAMRAIYKLPEYFKKVGYVNPNDPTDGPFQYAYNTSKHWFVWSTQYPSLFRQFNNHMSAYHQGRPSWMDADFFPVHSVLTAGARRDADSVFLVDVGGGLGHDLMEFSQKHPSTPGRLILQDKRDVIAQIQGGLGEIEAMAHNFFTKQPIQGARAYYLHSVLHDWPDNECIRILSCIAGSMEPGYSKLLINENIVPDQGADWQITGLDLMLMTLVSARERREGEWRQLLAQAGFQIVHIWTYSAGVESLIECELV
ncbi:putative hydroxyindole O-methyltransferase [Talaromyces proteolyticus]|uniref:Hydroxyindole O-methyltransferase n=1 Tax=Talaromyces proteolyticus TaxID=1131652 RepID=A0AAD4PVX7_9EURO|nr:putative hydroxyindole O-methyltransferase [Talaromyces proteolyticus]KAH8691903.1 putative hydroxyindole O-methyltransferase [Talaromyces proteolyticus]